ncbi:MAG: electron transport complex subunit RsxC, partial [Gammaproteobacteria bacterium]|nr:electron transport complex subunit RsxC [Gammaproteobacteria bacterium]
RNWRVEREKEEKAAKLAARAAAKPAAKPAAAGAAAAPTSMADDPKKALIEAAMARAKAQKEAVEAKNTGSLTTAQQAQIDATEARRARAAELADGDKPE